MQNAQLRQYFKDEGITPAEVAKRLGYRYSYVIELLNGTTPLTNSARFRIMQAYPRTGQFLLKSEQVEVMDVQNQELTR